MREIKEKVKAMALHLYRTQGIKPLCEECFIVADPKCPDFPHRCALEEALENPEEREWVLKYLADKIEMRRKWREANRELL